LFIKITLGDAKGGNVFISSVQTGDPLPGDQYSETVTLNFSQVKFEYTAQNPDHTAGKTTVGEFVIS
jgi:type VI protein secretion system component Hcp